MKKIATIALLFTGWLLTVKSFAQDAGSPVILKTWGLSQNSSLKSENKKYKLVLQTDGNLVIYENETTPIWATHTNGKGGNRLDMQDDGNLVLYNVEKSPLWSTDTYQGGPDKTGSFVILENDGTLVLFNAKGHAIWTSKRGRLY